MSMILTKIQFEGSTAPSEFISGDSPIYSENGHTYLKGSNEEVSVADESTFSLEDIHLKFQIA